MPTVWTPERFWATLAKTPAGCWEWPKGRNKQGYGHTRYRNRFMRTHRLAWLFAHGPIPEGLFVCHRCDNPPCCNPAHLFVGTRTDNARDASRKGRLNVSRCAGAANGNARLVRADVERIKTLLARGVYQRDIAAQFEITQSVISKINTGRHWLCKQMLREAS